MRYFACIILLAVAGCSTQERAAPLRSDSDLRADLGQIQGWIPTNSSVADVQRIMQQHGFGCLILTNRPDGSGSILCGCSYTNTTTRHMRRICLSVGDGIPVIAYEHTVSTPATPPNNHMQPTPR